MRKAMSLLAAVLLLLLSGIPCLPVQAEELPVETITNPWYKNASAQLKVGNPTQMRGRFFTTLWGGTTSDMDVQSLLYDYSLAVWDAKLGRFRFDDRVVEGAMTHDDGNGNRTYTIILTDSLTYSDGTQITVRDYAFSLLLQMDPAVAETGGTPADCSWLLGCDEYLSGKKKALSGLRVIGDNILQITMRADSMPYFYEMNRLSILPYPIAKIAPGAQVKDNGKGVYLTKKLTAKLLKETVLDEKNGYMSHPSPVTGPFVLESFDGKTAKLAVNGLFKGTEEGYYPRIGRLEYTLAENKSMISELEQGTYGLLNKVTTEDSIREGFEIISDNPASFAMEYELRSGLTMLWFTETGYTTQDPAVRQAIACCFDRDAFIKQYTGSFGRRTDGFYGLGQWMYRMASGTYEYPGTLPENATEEEKAAYEEAVKAWQGVTLDNLTVYGFDTKRASEILEQAGWNLNQEGNPFEAGKDSVRYRKTGRGLVGLNLTLAIPNNMPETLRAINDHLVNHLQKAGISLRVKTVSMEKIQEAYEGRKENGYDMLYLGEDFRIIFDPEILKPARKENTGADSITAVKEELYSLALDMVRTEPENLTGFAKKWVKLQERITETLPLIPVYSNMYFDFFTRKLNDYDITQALTWGQAVIRSYICDTEDLDAEEQEKIRTALEEFEGK